MYALIRNYNYFYNFTFPKISIFSLIPVCGLHYWYPSALLLVLQNFAVGVAVGSKKNVFLCEYINCPKNPTRYKYFSFLYICITFWFAVCYCCKESLPKIARWKLHSLLQKSFKLKEWGVENERIFSCLFILFILQYDARKTIQKRNCNM